MAEIDINLSIFVRRHGKRDLQLLYPNIVLRKTRLKFRKYLGGMGKGTYIVFKYCFEKNAFKNFANIFHKLLNSCVL